MPSPWASPVAARSTSSCSRSTGSTMSLYEVLRDAIRAEEPVALATMVEGPDAGAGILVRPGSEPMGGLGDPDLDRVVARDALAELAAGITAMRHYGFHGEARRQDVAVFIESFAPPPQMIVF